MEAHVHDGAAGEADEMPAVKMSRVQHGVLGEEDERLYLSNIARGQGAISVGQGAGGKVHGFLVKLVASVLALGDVADGKDHVGQPIIRILDDAVVVMIHVVQDGQELRLGEAGVEGPDLGHVVVDNGLDLMTWRKRPGCRRLREVVIGRSS